MDRSFKCKCDFRNVKNSNESEVKPINKKVQERSVDSEQKVTMLILLFS